MGNQNAYIVKLALWYNKIISLDTHGVSTFLFRGSENQMVKRSNNLLQNVRANNDFVKLYEIPFFHLISLIRQKTIQ